MLVLILPLLLLYYVS